MKKICSLLVLTLTILAGCSGVIADAKKTYQDYRDCWKTGDYKKCMDYWHPAILAEKSEMIEKTIQINRDEFGDLLNFERLDYIDERVIETWLYSGLVFHDVVEFDITIRFPQIQDLPPRQKKLVEKGPLVIREIAYLAKVNDQMKIIQIAAK